MTNPIKNYATFLALLLVENVLHPLTHDALVTLGEVGDVGEIGDAGEIEGEPIAHIVAAHQYLQPHYARYLADGLPVGLGKNTLQDPAVLAEYEEQQRAAAEADAVRAAQIEEDRLAQERAEQERELAEGEEDEAAGAGVIVGSIPGAGEPPAAPITDDPAAEGSSAAEPAPGAPGSQGEGLEGQKPAPGDAQGGATPGKQGKGRNRNG